MKFEIIRASHTAINDEPGYPGPDVKKAYKEITIPYEGSDEVVDWYININTLDELVALNEEVGHDLIFSAGQIRIHDDYME